MLLDIIEMPLSYGVPIKRQQTIVNRLDHFNTSMRDQDDFGRVHTCSGLNLPNARLNVAADINRPASKLYKAYYTSSDYSHIFEVVFSNESEGLVCLYVKIIGPNWVRFGVSTQAVKFYNKFNHSLFPISHFFVANQITDYSTKSYLTTFNNPNFEQIVPIVLDLKTLYLLFSQAAELGPEITIEQMNKQYLPLEKYLPQIYEALSSGMFVKSPFDEIRQYHPNIDIKRSRWFSWQEVAHSVQVQNTTAHVNHPAFDDISLKCVNQPVVSFRITALMSHAIECISGVWTVEVDSQYQSLVNYDVTMVIGWFEKILYDSVITYCQLEGIDCETFLKTERDISTITVSRNIYDEIYITIRDNVHDKTTLFYSSFPTLALSTMAVGWYS